MAEITIKLDQPTFHRLKAAAAAAGQSIEDYARDLIEDHVNRLYPEVERAQTERPQA